ncbi:hypothetical protein NCCNTM_53900 [Mycolicibacterium sp. NCC-Tsukiji]|nr:hypothetical protein NCCNTM_53900 [Mycolicibacterium sp. NCC-Tsukiji]
MDLVELIHRVAFLQHAVLGQMFQVFLGPRVYRIHEIPSALLDLTAVAAEEVAQSLGPTVGYGLR